MARRSAIKARTQAINQIHALVVTAPDQVKHTPPIQSFPPKPDVRSVPRSGPGTADTTGRHANKLSAPWPAVTRTSLRRSESSTHTIGGFPHSFYGALLRGNPPAGVAEGFRR